jgi:hypothetical protein
MTYAVPKYMNFNTFSKNIYWLSLCCYFDLHSVHKTWTRTLISHYSLPGQPSVWQPIKSECFSFFFTACMCLPNKLIQDSIDQTLIMSYSISINYLISFTIHLILIWKKMKWGRGKSSSKWHEQEHRECCLESDGEEYVGPGWYRNIHDTWKTLSHFM